MSTVAYWLSKRLHDSGGKKRSLFWPHSYAEVVTPHLQFSSTKIDLAPIPCSNDHHVVLTRLFSEVRNNLSYGEHSVVRLRRLPQTCAISSNDASDMPRTCLGMPSTTAACAANIKHSGSRTHACPTTRPRLSIFTVVALSHGDGAKPIFC